MKDQDTAPWSILKSTVTDHEKLKNEEDAQVIVTSP